MGGWFLHQLKWNEKDTWGMIIDNYVDLAISWSNKPIEESSTQEVKAKDITVVFDGINSSPKDQEHIRRCNHLSGNITINEDLPHIIPREKFLDNAFNKNNLIVAVVEKMEERGIKLYQCRDDADTDVVKVELKEGLTGSIKVCFIIHFRIV